MRFLGIFIALAAVATAGCVAPPPEATTTPTSPPTEGDVEVVVASPAFQHGGDIPRKHTCDGENVSPAFEISFPNATPASVALIAFDPDAPLPQLPQRNITHWLVWNMTSANGSIEMPEGGVPAGAVQGANNGGAPKYAGPCPPQGSPAHRYIFTFFALDAPIALDEGASRSELEQAIAGHDLASTTYTGLYARALTPATRDGDT